MTDERIEKDLHRVIKALEYMQETEYSSTRALALSYLVDIKDNNVPDNLVSDDAKKMKDIKEKKYKI